MTIKNDIREEILKELQKNKKDHQYNKALAEFKNREKLFLKIL